MLNIGGHAEPEMYLSRHIGVYFLLGGWMDHAYCCCSLPLIRSIAIYINNSIYSKV